MIKLNRVIYAITCNDQIQQALMINYIDEEKMKKSVNKRIFNQLIRKAHFEYLKFPFRASKGRLKIQPSKIV